MTPDGPISLRVLRLDRAAHLPARATPGASGFDVCARLDVDLVLGPAPVRVPTGIAIELPGGYDAQLRPRSGLMAKGVASSFGTIDADYRGEVFVTMWTFGGLERYVVHDGDRIAQLVVARLAHIDLVEADALSASERGAGGHGSTGR